MTTLYEIAEEFRAFDAMVDERSGDMTGIEDDVAAWWADLEMTLDAKVDAAMAFVREQEALATARSAEADRLYETSQVAKAKAARIKSLTLKAIQASGKTSAGSRFIASVVKNGGNSPIEVTAPAAIFPESMRSVRYEVDTAELRKVLLEGYALVLMPEGHVDAVNPGCELDAAIARGATTAARILPRGSHIRIK